MIFLPIKLFKKLKVPLYLSVLKAGFPSPADDFLDKEIDLNDYLIQNKDATFLARVEGDSMEDTLFNGDILVIDRSLQPSNNDVIVAILDGEFTVKRYLTQKGKIILHADNPTYPPIALHEGIVFRVWGVVTHSIRNL